MVSDKPDAELRRSELEAELDSQDDASVLESRSEPDSSTGDQADADSAGMNASGIISHVLTCRKEPNGTRATSKSSFKPPHSTDAVWTRVAFYTSDTARLVLSEWKNLGPGNPYKTVIHSWYYDNRRVGRALVLYWMNGTTWRDWENC